MVNIVLFRVGCNCLELFKVCRGVFFELGYLLFRKLSSVFINDSKSFLQPQRIERYACKVALVDHERVLTALFDSLGLVFSWHDEEPSIQITKPPLLRFNLENPAEGDFVVSRWIVYYHQGEV